ncbi:hypothetical protein BZA05DRAFT_418832 [Tricharina praecox]|uniref:uncharacterized protein n=1 Tax=Tricharina praecox TaxID=43433 RepID=UPI00221F2B28|nr:uncharacterized protein BZA05DRAFT_418832 [Tricharina praecox]KAI5851955.1 hypothetical protein BZA05DRAFT_418832 [Tricharina praecox]
MSVTSMSSSSSSSSPESDCDWDSPDPTKHYWSKHFGYYDDNNNFIILPGDPKSAPLPDELPPRIGVDHSAKYNSVEEVESSLSSVGKVCNSSTSSSGSSLSDPPHYQHGNYNRPCSTPDVKHGNYNRPCSSPDPKDHSDNDSNDSSEATAHTQRSYKNSENIDNAMAAIDPNNPASKYHAVNHISLDVQNINNAMKRIATECAALMEIEDDKWDRFEYVDLKVANRRCFAARDWTPTIPRPAKFPPNIDTYVFPQYSLPARPITPVRIHSPEPEPESEPEFESRKRSGRNRYIPRSPPKDALPLPLGLAEKMIELLRIGAYIGAFPTTIGEYRLIQQYRDGGERGRIPLRPHRYTLDASMKNWYDQPLLVDVETMVKSWGWCGKVPVVLAELAIMISTLADMKRLLGTYHDKRNGVNTEVSSPTTENGYESDAESDGGKEGGKYGYKEREVYNFQRDSRGRLPKVNYPRLADGDLRTPRGTYYSGQEEEHNDDDNSADEYERHLDLYGEEEDPEFREYCAKYEQDPNEQDPNEEDSNEEEDSEYKAYCAKYEQDSNEEEYPKYTSTVASGSTPDASYGSQSRKYEESSNEEDVVYCINAERDRVVVVVASKVHSAVSAGWMPLEEEEMRMLLAESHDGESVRD